MERLIVSTGTSVKHIFAFMQINDIKKEDKMYPLFFKIILVSIIPLSDIAHTHNLLHRQRFLQATIGHLFCLLV